MLAKGISLFLWVLLGSLSCLYAQTTIGSTTELKAKGLVTVKSNINNSSNKLDLTETDMSLSGTNQSLNTSAPLTIKSLIVEGGGTKTTLGEFIITNAITFTQGLLVPGSGKLLYTGPNTLTGSGSSYVNGTLYQRGGTVRFFPIGAGNTYMPMSLNGVSDTNAEIGVTPFTNGINVTLPADINTIASNRHWLLSATNGSYAASGASLYVPGSSVDAAPKLVVVEADDTNGATAVNLGGGINGDFVSGFSAVTKPVLTIGIVEKVDLRILDLITPFNDDAINDKLKIVNVEYTFENKVTLLDRWGVPVKEWKNFRNYDDASNPNSDGYDFTRLSPGNYICVLEYKLSVDAPLEKKNQMITVLKGN